jgi:hypothetical protein
MALLIGQIMMAWMGIGIVGAIWLIASDHY